METSQENTEPQGPKAGNQIRTARINAGLEPARIAADLRISVAAFETLEAGQYDRLPGDPYVRALLGSVARILHLDPLKLVAAYNADIGSAAAIPPVTPYKDLSQTHVVAHKQIFILLLAVLLFTLLLVLGRLNSSHKSSPAEAGDRADSALEVSPSQDSLPESNSLRPDTSIDSVAPAAPVVTPAMPPAPAKESIQVAVAPKPVDTVKAPVAPAQPAAPVKSGPLLVTPLLDSIVMVVKTPGKPDSTRLLRLGSPVELTASDTLNLILDRKKCVEISVGGRVLIPNKKRFRIVGSQFSYF